MKKLRKSKQAPVRTIHANWPEIHYCINLLYEYNRLLTHLKRKTGRTISHRHSAEVDGQYVIRFIRHFEETLLGMARELKQPVHFKTFSAIEPEASNEYEERPKSTPPAK
ncbi:hypothetical protein [Desulfurispira natronophila]|uniref:Uncharacterized protein n=1 Tax=Desulfurispira natronophila TaxID=682562 RepID=A0A7W8DHT8_9BACT|nr:hypothetical protein [Desulfurispira natronophila]MBB5022638.1 hypothetical protein [Desulfurispira natronophila]